MTDNNTASNKKKVVNFLASFGRSIGKGARVVTTTTTSVTKSTSGVASKLISSVSGLIPTRSREVKACEKEITKNLELISAVEEENHHFYKIIGISVAEAALAGKIDIDSFCFGESMDILPQLESNLKKITKLQQEIDEQQKKLEETKLAEKMEKLAAQKAAEEEEEESIPPAEPEKKEPAARKKEAAAEEKPKKKEPAARKKEAAAEEKPKTVAPTKELLLAEIKKEKDGIGVIDLGERLGVTWQSLIPILRNMLKEKSIRKEGTRYLI